MVANLPRNLNKAHVEHALFGKVYQKTFSPTSWTGWFDVDGVEVDFSFCLPYGTVNDVEVMKPQVLALCDGADPMIRTVLERRGTYRAEVAAQIELFIQDWLFSDAPVTAATLAERLTLTHCLIDAEALPHELLKFGYHLDDESGVISIRVDIDGDLKITHVEGG